MQPFVYIDISSIQGLAMLFSYVFLASAVVFAVLHYRTGKYPFSAAVTLSCLIAVFVWADFRITAAYALSVVGDWFMAHSGGKNGDKRLMGGILFFFLAHACFLSYSIYHMEYRPQLLWLIPAGMLVLGYGIFLWKKLLPAIPDRTIRIAAAAYTGISLAVLTSSLLSRDAPLSKWLFCAGIAMIMFSDTLIALSRFLGKKGVGRFICPTYFACHILVAASVLAFEGLFGSFVPS